MHFDCGAGHMRKRWIYPESGEPFEVTADYAPEPLTPFIIGEIPAYQSPIDGRVIESRTQRREDMKRNQCRPWEGKQQELNEAQRHRGYAEQHLDRTLHEATARSFYEMPPSKRRILTGH
jgi:hypothetical protein